MATSLKIILHRKTYDDETRPVMLQFIQTLTTGNIWKRRMLCKVKPPQFDKSSGRVKKHPNQVFLNAKINEAQHRLLQCESEGRRIDPNYIIATSAKPINPAGRLLEHARQYVENCKQKGQYHTGLKYEGHVNRLAMYLGKNGAGEQLDIHMDDVDEKWILTWSVWLRANGVNSDNTLHRRMAFITTLFNDARKRGLTKSDPMVFLEFKEAKVRKPKLTVEQLQQLESVELSGGAFDARNTFMLQFFAYGTRISDALTWKKEDVRKEGSIWYLHYRSMKTGDLELLHLTGDGF